MNDQAGIQEPPLVDPGAIEEIAPGVHVVPDRRIEFVPNVGVVEGERAVLVVDTAMGHRNGEAILALAEQVAGDRKVILTTTHFHPEHAFGAKPFERSITYVMNAAQAEELAAKGQEYVEMFSTFGPGLAELLDGVELVPPDLTYEGRLRIDLGGKVVELLEVGPAHTRGDQLISLPEEGVLFAGDLVENAFFPILPDPDAQGDKWLEVLGTMGGLGPRIVVGGHGAVAGPELIDAFQDLEEVRDRTAELEAGGADAGSIVPTIEGEVLERYDGWGNEVWIKSAVESFQKGPATYVAETLLQARGIDKSYGPVKALRAVDFELRGHEIHGLLGENGSGKSTLLKILAGQLAPDAGGVYLDGEPIRFGDAADALAAGIATVTQETTLVPELSVAENILLGPRKPKRWWGIDWRRTRAAAIEMLGRLQLDIDPSVPAGSLRPEQQQMVEITRALSMDARVVILDEPTSSLPDDQVAALFEVVRALRDNGVAVAFVSHRFNEIFDLVDHVSVLRDGQLVGGGAIGDYDRASLVRQMIGQELESLAFEPRPSQHSDPVLRVRDFHVPGRVHGVDVAVERGEIVGVAGLVGSGRSALLDGLFGLEAEAFGGVELDGVAGVAPDPRAAMNRGFGYVPADRKTLGAVMDMSIRENLLMAQTSGRFRGGRPPRGSERDACEATIDRFRIVTPNQDNAVKNLSGGNQQKVVLAKWIATSPKVLMLDEPTRGVDVGAKAEIYKLLNQIKEEDVAILVSSSEAEELLLLCDTILVMHRGRLAATLSREEATESKISYYGMGHG